MQPRDPYEASRAGGAPGEQGCPASHPSAVSHQVLSSFILRSSNLLVSPKWKVFHFIVLTYIFSLKKRLLLPAGTKV